MTTGGHTGTTGPLETPDGPDRAPGGTRGIDPASEPPPFLKRWRNLYAAVLIYLLALIILFWMFTEHYS